MPQEMELFEERLIRRVWHKNEWYYSLVDVVAVLTDTPNPNNYWYMMKQQVQTEGFRDVLKYIEPLKLPAADNRLRLTDTCTRQTLLRLIQSIPSPKAEPFKQWLAKVGNERIEEVEHPEIALERMKEYWRKKGYEEDWIDARVASDLARNELTDEWAARGAKQGIEYAILTNDISQGTFGFSVAAYKEYKLLPAKANLRDHMNTMELVLCSLGEATATLYHRTRDSQGFGELQRDAKDAGSLAGDTRRRIEQETGTQIVSKENKMGLVKRPRKKPH